MIVCKQYGRDYVQKVKTGAIWSAPKGTGRPTREWTKESLGFKTTGTKPVGYTTRQFLPNSERNKRRFKPY